MSRLIRVSSRALGEQRRVIVRVYDTLAEMRRAGERFNGESVPRALGLCQSYADADDRCVVPVVRVVRGNLGTEILSHEMLHAATAIYGSSIASETRAIDVLTHHNEPFAHLYGDLLARLVDALYRHGYYDRQVP